MIKHVVCWRLKPEAEGRTKIENAEILSEKLKELKDKIQAINTLEIGINLHGIDDENYDVVLISTFAGKDDLLIYQKHPAHLELIDFVRKVRESRVAVDFEF